MRLAFLVKACQLDTMQLKDAVTDPVDFAIGARMRARRRQLNLSQSDLAAKLGVSFQQVQKYERGVNRVSGSTLVAAAAALTTTVGWLVGEEGAAAQSDDVFHALATPGALEMLQAYARIPDSRARAALLALTQQISAHDIPQGDEHEEAETETASA
jgi:transcriptional regulator with XRE-family HTH domain